MREKNERISFEAVENAVRQGISEITNDSDVEFIELDVDLAESSFMDELDFVELELFLEDLLHLELFIDSGEDLLSGRTIREITNCVCQIMNEA